MHTLLRFAVLVAIAATGLSAQEQSAGVTPEARAIIERHLEALGPDNPSVTSMRATGTLAMPAQGISGTVEVISARPNKALLKAQIPGIGALESGFDGEHGWSLDPILGPALLEGTALDQAKFDAAFDGPFHDLSRFRSLIVAGTTSFDGKQVHQVDAVNIRGDKSTEYFDVETGLHVGSVSTRDTPMGPVEVTAIIRDYRDAGGSLQAHELVQQMMGVEQVMKIERFEFNVANADTFAMPPAVKALIK